MGGLPPGGQPDAAPVEGGEVALVQPVAALVWPTFETARVEQTLHEREEQLRLALDAGHLGTWDVDLSTGTAVWSANHFTLLGYEPLSQGEATIDMWRRRVHPEDREAVADACKRAQRERTPYRADYRIVRADTGEVIWLSAVGRCLYDETGAATRFAGMICDITAHKRVEAVLARYHLLSEHAYDIILFMRQDGQIVEANHAALVAYGKSTTCPEERPYHITVSLFCAIIAARSPCRT